MILTPNQPVAGGNQIHGLIRDMAAEDVEVVPIAQRARHAATPLLARRC